MTVPRRSEIIRLTPASTLSRRRQCNRFQPGTRQGGRQVEATEPRTDAVTSISASTLYERKRPAVSVTANKRIARRFFDDVLARRNEDAVDELIAPDAVVCMPTG